MADAPNGVINYLGNSGGEERASVADQFRELIYFAATSYYTVRSHTAPGKVGALVEPRTTVTFLSEAGTKLGYMRFVGDPFGIEDGTQDVITGFSLTTVSNGLTTQYSGLAPMAASTFQSTFIDLPMGFDVLADVFGLTAGGMRAQGGGGSDTFDLTSGNDIVTTGGGDDRLAKSGAGNVVFHGGLGVDVIGFAPSDGFLVPPPLAQKLVVNLTKGRGDNPYGGTLRLFGVENVIGTDVADRITGDEASNLLDGRGAAAGRDVIDARGGDDKVFVGLLSSARADGGTGTDQLVFSGSADLTAAAIVANYTNFEDFMVWSFGGDHFILRANDSENVLTGGSGVDTFEGRGGDDTIYGGRAFNADFSNGADVAIFSGKIRNYLIEVVDFMLVVTDTRAGAPDGIDHLDGIETLHFSNGEISVATLFPQALHSGL